MTNVRKRTLLDLPHFMHECTNCEKYKVDGLEPAHENGIVAGKGQSIKSHDNRHAALCHDCHAWYDSGRGRDPSDRFDGDRYGKHDMWFRAHQRTFDRYWAFGWLAVVGPRP